MNKGAKAVMTLSLVMLSAGGMRGNRILPADSVETVAVRDSVEDLGEIVVSAVGNSRRLLTTGADGALMISAENLSEHPTLLGSNDALGIIRSLPSVGTSNELQASINVRGAGTGSNRFGSDGMRVVNPLHILGLYSTYNPSVYRSYRFYADRMPAVFANCTAGYFEAGSAGEPDSELSGELSAGLIESHFGVRIPLKRDVTSVAIGLRRTYLGLLYPALLKFDNSELRYDFTDANLSLSWRPGNDDLINFTFYGNRDLMNMTADRHGNKEGRFGWGNLCGGLSWKHGRLDVNAYCSSFSNLFQLSEGGRTLDLPSRFTEIAVRASFPWRGFVFEADVNCRYSSGQRNRALAVSSTGVAKHALEWNLAAAWSRLFAGSLRLDAGLRMAFYRTHGYGTVVPLPRVALRWSWTDALGLGISYSRLAMFDVLVQETTAGLPADFRINCYAGIKPEVAEAFAIGADGTIPGTGISYTVEGYIRYTRNVTEFGGSLLDLANNGYDPLADMLHGSNLSYGLSVTLLRQWGRVRGRAGYNLGRSQSQFRELGDGKFPSAYDRLHDFNASLSWEPLDRLIVSGSFTHATGLPYTRARYGYMIGENLICEYEPRNSSRLPAYNRLDLSASYTLRGRGRLRHKFNISVYNATAARNVLFYYTSYSVDKGIRQRESSMKNVIPSVTYILNF